MTITKQNNIRTTLTRTAPPSPPPKKKIIQPEFSPGHSKCHWKVLTFSLQIGHNDTLINTGNKSLYKTYCYEEKT